MNENRTNKQENPAELEASDVDVMPQIVTQEMLNAAVKKAVELGMIPKYAGEEDYLTNWSNIQKVVYAALYAA